jgi:hypothetical protein
MNLFLPDPLTREEMRALKLVATAPPFRGLSHKVQRRLVDLGFAETVRDRRRFVTHQIRHERKYARLTHGDPNVTVPAPACASPNVSLSLSDQTCVKRAGSMLA